MLRKDELFWIMERAWQRAADPRPSRLDAILHCTSAYTRAWKLKELGFGVAVIASPIRNSTGHDGRRHETRPQWNHERHQTHQQAEYEYNRHAQVAGEIKEHSHRRQSIKSSEKEAQKG